MALITRTYNFVDGTTAYGSQVESEIANLANTLNSLNAGSTNWGTISVKNLLTTPLIADNGTGSNNIAEFKANGTTKVTVGSTGAVTLGAALAMGTNKITGLAAASANGDAVRYEQLTAFNIPFVRDLIISYSPGIASHLFWDYILLTDGSGNYVSTGYTGNNLDITTSGANGLDTGSVAASKLYYIWAISDGTNFKGLFSLSQSTPTMPNGYTYKLLIGCVWTDGASQILKGLQIGKKVEFETSVSILSDTTHVNSLETLDIASFVPVAIAWEVDLYFLHTASYSASGTHGFLIALSGINTSTARQLMQQNATASSFTVSTTASVLVVNEDGSPVNLYWEVDNDATNRTAYHTYGFITGYTLTRLSIY